MNPAGVMAGVAMGGAMGQQMAGMMNQMGQMANQGFLQASQMPPQTPQMDFYVFVGGQQTGPYNYAQLEHLVSLGQLTKDTYVWKVGMPNWDFAKNTELNRLFPMTPPAPPVPPVPPVSPVSPVQP